MAELKILTPAKAIRAHCLACYGISYEVGRCEANTCALYPYRRGHKSRKTKLSRVKAIRAYCMGCVAGEISEIRKCTGGPAGKGYHCPIWHYRMGFNPTQSEAKRKANASAVIVAFRFKKRDENEKTT